MIIYLSSTLSSFIAVIFVVLEEDFFCDADEGDLSEQGQVP